MRTATRRVAITAVAIAGLSGAGVAFASWAATGTGSGTGSASTSVPFVVQQNGSASGLYPTGQASVPFTVKNSNPYPVTLSTAKATNFKVDAAHSGCNVSSLSAANVALADTIAAGGTSATRQLVISMDNSAVDTCQGATFTFDIVITGASG
jgi:hypothetical protein